MPKIAFSKQRIGALPTPGKGRTYYHDSRTPGLCVAVTAKGSKTFYNYKWVDGRPARIRIGRFPDVTVDNARKRAAELNGRIARGEDPQADRQQKRREATLGDLYEYWMEHHSKPRKRTWREDESRYTQFLRRWHNRKLSKITTADVQALHTRVGKQNGIFRANRLLEQLRAMFRQAAPLGYEGRDPTEGIRKFREKSRDRYLQPDELRPFFEALEAERNEGLRDFFLLALFTAARRANVLAMRWDEVNLATGVWRIPSTKSGEPVRLPLTPPALNILTRRLEASNGSLWVFPGRGRSGHLTEPKFAWRRICKRAGLENLRVHDLRRTLGSWGAATGASLLIVGKMLGHAEGSRATSIYARLGLDPVRDAASRAATAMLEAGGLLEGPEDKG